MRKSFVKKAISACLAAAMAVSMAAAPASVRTKADTVLPDPVVYLNFEEEAADGYFEGTGASAYLVNDPQREEAVVNDRITNVVKFERNRADSKYLRLHNRAGNESFTVLDGKSAFTISYWEYVLDSETSWSFFSKQNGTEAKARKYLGIISKDSSIAVEKENGKLVTTSAPAPSGDWRQMSYVVTDAGVDVYINGAFAVNLNMSTPIADILGSNPDTYLGYAPWGSGEGANMYMDEFKIYDEALNADQILLNYQSVIAGTDAPPRAQITELEATAGKLNDRSIGVKEDVTVSAFRAAAVTTPEDATITVYADSSKGRILDDTDVMGDGNVVVLSADEYRETQYTVNLMALPKPIVYLNFEDGAKNGYYEGTGAVAKQVNAPATEEVLIGNRYTQAVKFVRDGANSRYLLLANSTSDSKFSALNGKEAMTISYWENVLDTSTSWSFFSKNNATQASARRYIGILTKQTTVKIEKQNGGNTGVQVDSPYTRWRHVTITIDNTGASIYLNGVFMNKYNDSVSVKDILGDDPDTYLGLAPWGNGEGSNMYMDEFKLYDTALNEEQIRLDYEEEVAGIKAPDPAYIKEISDPLVANVESTDDGDVVNVKYGTTVSQLKNIITTDPEESTVTVYSDSLLTTPLMDSFTIGAGNMLVVSCDGYRNTEYTIKLIPYTVPTTITETEDTKVVSYGAQMLYQALGNSDMSRGPAYESDEIYANDDIGLGGWGTQATMNLPAQNLKQLQKIQIVARMSWYTKGGHWLQMRLFDTAGNYTTPAVASEYAFNTGMSTYSSYLMFDQSMETGFDPDSVDHIQFQFYGNQNGNGSAFGGIAVRDIIYTYAKTENEKALDVALAKAEAIAEPGAALQTAIKQAKEYKVAMAVTYDEIDAALSVSDELMGEMADTLNQLVPETDFETVAIRSSSVGVMDVDDITVDYGTTAEDLLTAGVLSYNAPSAHAAIYDSYGASVREADQIEGGTLLQSNMILKVKAPGYLSRNYAILVKAAPLNYAILSSVTGNVGYIAGNVIYLEDAQKNSTVTRFRGMVTCHPSTAEISVYDAENKLKTGSARLADGDRVQVEADDYNPYHYVIRFLDPVIEIQSLDASAGFLAGKGFYLKEGITVGELKKAITADSATIEVYRDVIVGTDGTINGESLRDDETVLAGDTVLVSRQDYSSSVYTVVDVDETPNPDLEIVSVNAAYATFIPSGLITEPNVTVEQLCSAVTANTDGVTMNVYRSGTVNSNGTLSDRGALMAPGDKIQLYNVLELSKAGWNSRYYRVILAKESPYQGGGSSSGGGGWAPPITGNVDITGTGTGDQTSSGSDIEDGDGNGPSASQSVRVTPKTITLKVGKRKKIQILNADNATKIVLKSNNKKVARVSSKGSVRAVRKGKTKIRVIVTIDGKKTKFIIPVTVKK